ncbi:hypothetical protein MMC26_002483 [Xylographa opegraphella]|nr:hypothetical protein [Xylographa opegraphella]
MRPRSLLTLLLLPLTTSTPPPQEILSPPPPQHIFSNPPPTSPLTTRIPTVHESAILARRILQLSSIGTLSTVFPPTAAVDSSRSGPPPHLDGAPIGLMDYYATCAPAPHEPTVLAIAIATSFRNTAAGSNLTLSLRWHPPAHAPPERDPYTYSPANMPRFSLLGHVRALDAEEVRAGEVRECFLKRHPDAQAWTPGNEIHLSYWARVVVEQVYWIGGFGDRAYIGWIPVEEWRGVTQREVDEARLVGEV